MVQFINLPKSQQAQMVENIGHSLGQGLSSFATTYFANRDLNRVLNDPSLKNAPLSEKLDKLERTLSPYGEYGQNLLARRLGIEQQREKETELKKSQILRKKENEAAKRMGLNLEDIEDPGLRKAIFTQSMKNQGKLEQFRQEAQMLGLNLEGNQTGRGASENALDQLPISGELGSAQQPVAQMQPPFQQPSQRGRPANASGPIQQQPQPQQGQSNQPFDTNRVLRTSLISPNAARVMQGANEIEVAQEKERNRRFTEERKFHTGFTKEAHKKADALRESIPRKENALSAARDAVESKEVGAFSLNKLADVTGFDFLRTSKGAELITASKENLLSNLSKVSSKGQNLWFEQRLNSMFAKTGQTEEANLTTQEMIEAEVLMDKAYLNAYDKIVEDDEKQYGFEKKDSEKRARDLVKPYNKEIFGRTQYRMREIEEQEKGGNELRKQVGKPVIKGTPFTLANAKLFKEKYGKDALQKAKELGYSVPTLEDFAIYQMRPREYGGKVRIMATGTIFDLVEDEPLEGQEGFMQLAEKAPMPKDKSFFNDLKDYGKTILKGTAEGLGRLGTTMGPLIDERNRPREEQLQEQTETLDRLLPTDEGFTQRGLRRGLRMGPEMAAFPIGGPVQAIVRSGAAGYAGEGAKALGAPEWLQTAAELSAFIGPDVAKKLLQSGSNAELIKKAKEFGLTDEQITPLIQSDFKQKWLAKFAPKRGSTQKALNETKAGLGQLRDTIKMSPEAAAEIGEKANGTLINELKSKLVEMPQEVQKLIKGDLDDLLKNKITGRSLINFWADINSKYGAGGEQLGILKEPIKNALSSISPSVAQDFEFSNELFKKYYPISSKLKPNLTDDIVRAGEILGLGGSMLGALTHGIMGPLYGFIGEKIGRKVAQQMLINPHFQQLSQKAVNALNQNKFGIFKKISDEFADAIKKYSPKAGKELEKLSEDDLQNLFSHQE